MEIVVTRQKFNRQDKRTGGEYATNIVEINVDDSLPMSEQRRLVIHSTIENYCRNWAHDNVNELEQLIVYALDQLDE